MKRILTFWLLLALAAGAIAQTPTVVEKPAPNAATSTTKPAAKTVVPTKPATQTAGKPSPATAKAGTTPAQKPAIAVKAAVVAVQPANAKVVPVPAKPLPAAKAKVTPAPANKLSPAMAAKAVTVPAPKLVGTPAAKANATSTVKPVVTVQPAAPKALAGKPVVAIKPVAQATPAPGKPVIAVATTAHVAVAPKAGIVAVQSGAARVAPAKDPFSGKKTAPSAQEKVQVPAVKAGATVVAVKDVKAVVEKKPAPRKVDAAGRRDPFVSPVVSLGAVGSGCSSGKRCLAIDQIALRGVVKSDTGMIAVVVNAMDKAYFLRENDPVFDGYVIKITGDSIVFKETFKDKLGKPLTRDVTKTISRPVA